jgi:hypothetical protein
MRDDLSIIEGSVQERVVRGPPRRPGFFRLQWTFSASILPLPAFSVHPRAWKRL